MYSRLNCRNPLEHDEALIRALSREFHLSEKITEVMIGRGYRDADAVEKFLNPSARDLHDPYLLSGMAETVERIRQAIDQHETVAVYGDYDADGICATAILTKFLVSQGVTVAPYIPDRNRDGYGITEKALERIVEDFLPDLLITCDCGISARDELLEIVDSGVDVIVTDHHEVPKLVPDCPVVNPKLSGQDYPFDGLCGAGVALKVVQAIAGVNEAFKYLDLAALATVADLMPLVDENRAIVALGLAKINAGKFNKGLKALLGAACTGTVTASDIAYKIAPRINAAGRMGDATRALNLMLSESDAEIAAIHAEIQADNDRRKEICAQVFAQAVSLIRQDAEAFTHGRGIVLNNDAWEKGLTSIVAAQIAGEYKRPTFLMVHNGDKYKGTARSVTGVNVYDVLSSCEDVLTEFGGHAQAAGFSVKSDMVDELRARIDAYLKQNYAPELFMPSGCYDAELAADGLTFQLAKELDRLEPFGNGNPRPVFKVRVDRPQAEYMKGKTAHVVIKLPKCNVNAFGYGRCLPVLQNAAYLDLAVELGVNPYNGREYLSVTLRDFDFASLAPRPCPRADAALAALSGIASPVACERIGADAVGAMLDGADSLGTLVVCYRVETYLHAVQSHPKLASFWHSCGSRESAGNFNRIVLMPSPDFDAFGYDRIIVLDASMRADCLPFAVDKRSRLYTVAESDASVLSKLRTDRQTMVRCFTALKKEGGGADLYEWLAAAQEGLDKEQMLFAYLVFRELGIVSYADGAVTVNKSVKRDLNESAIYRYVSEVSGHAVGN